MTLKERKELFIARATRRFDTPQIRKEALALFNKINGKNLQGSRAR